MTDTNASEATVKGKSPSLIAYHVREREGGKAIYTPIGAVWPHKKGGGANLQFHLFPADGTGKVVLFPPSEKQD